jgi:hypothetical protein
MPKKILLALIMVLVVTLVFSASVLAAEEPDMVGVTIINRTNGLVYVSVVPDPATVVYFMAVITGDRERFTVPRGIYSHTTYACGKTVYGKLDLRQQVTLVFTPCGSDPANSGERGIEKIRLDTYPFRSDFNFKIQ